MKMQALVFLALLVCAYAADVKEKEDKVEPEQNKDKRQTQGDFYPSFLYRTSRKQEQVAPVEEPQDDSRIIISSRADTDEYRPGQVFSLNPQELLELQPERKAPLASGQQLQQLYTSQQQDHRQNLQPVYFLEPQTGRQVGTPPRIGASTVSPLSVYQQPQQLAPSPQQSLQQLLLQALGQQVGAQTVAPTTSPAPPLFGNQPLHQLSSYPQNQNQQNQRDYLQQLINLHALLSSYNAAPTSQAPPQYSSFAPQYPSPQAAPTTSALPQYSSFAPQYQSPQTIGNSQTQQQNYVPQNERQLYYLRAPGGQVFASTTPGPFELIRSQQQNRNNQLSESAGRYDDQQLLLLQALAQTPPLTQPPQTSTQSLRQFYEDSQKYTEAPVVRIGSTGRSFSTTSKPQFETNPQYETKPQFESKPVPSYPSTLKPALSYSTTAYPGSQTLRQFYEDSQNYSEKPVTFNGSAGLSFKPEITSPSSQLETTSILSNKQLQELDSIQDELTPEQKFREIHLINALQEKQSQSPPSQNDSLEVSPGVVSRAQLENEPTNSSSNPLTEDKEVGSHAVIARPHYSSNGAEASVGAALSVSDSGANPSESFDQELLALLGQRTVRPESQVYQPTPSVASQYQQVAQQTVAPQYQQAERYVNKPSKKPTKLHPKVYSHVAPPQSSAAPQQYLIETTNVQQQPQQQYRPAPQPQRPAQALRYVTVPSPQSYAQQALYERPESQGLSIVAAPKLQQARPQNGFRTIQYQQPEATKQYRLLDVSRPQAARPEQRVTSPSIERPVTYSNRYSAADKARTVKIYDPISQEGPNYANQKFILRPMYKTRDDRYMYLPGPSADTKTPHSSIYVSKNLAPKKVKSQPLKEQTSSEESEAQRGQSIEERRAQLPPPKNNRAYTPEEFAALVAAGYSVTPIPVAPLGHPGHPVHPVAESRSSVENASVAVASPSQRRPLYSRRLQHLHLSGDDAP